MHPYATDSHERMTVPAVLMVAAILAAFGLAKGIEVSGLQPQLWWVDVPAVGGFYSIFWRLFDRYLWRCRLFRAIGLIRVPDLVGRWHGQGVSSHTDRAGDRLEFEVEVTIAQRWTTCRVHLETRDSQSDSIIGAFLIGDGGQPSVSYEYRNEPRPHARDSMHGHRGMVRLGVVDPALLEGEYYTGRDRREYGTLRLTRRL
jgi:hypothetical protein